MLPKFPAAACWWQIPFIIFFLFVFVLSPFLVLLKMHIIVILCVILHLQGHCKNSNEEKNEWWYEINRNEMRKLISFFLPWGKIVIYSLQYVRSFYKISPVFLKDSLTSNFENKDLPHADFTHRLHQLVHLSHLPPLYQPWCSCLSASCQMPHAYTVHTHTHRQREETSPN